MMKTLNSKLACYLLVGFCALASPVQAEGLSAADQEYQQILSSFKVEKVEQAASLVDSFIQKYPTDSRLSEMQVLRLSAMFDRQLYAQLIEEVQLSYDGLAPRHREAATYMLCGAHGFSENYIDAVQAADRSLAKWPKGDYVEDVRYFKAVSLARLGYVEEVRALLEPMQAEEAESFEYLDGAMYELALLDFGAEAYEVSTKRLEELLTWLVDEDLLVDVKLLLAQNYAVVRERAKAESLYVEALADAQTAESPELEQKALFYLIDFYGREIVNGEANEQITKALPYYDAFFAKFSDSIYAAQVATVALPALEDAGRLEGGVEQLERVVRSYCAQGREEGLRRAASSLVWKKLKLGVKLTQIRESLSTESDPAFAAVMLMALTKVHQAGYAQSNTKWGQQLRFRALKESCFAAVLQLSEDQNLPSYINADLGWWLLENGDFPELAVERFKLAGSTKVSLQKEMALVGKMAALSLLTNEGYLEDSQRVLEGVVARAELSDSLREKAKFELAKVYDRSEQWKALSKLSHGYLFDEKFESERALMNFLLAKSYDRRLMTEEAIGQYTRVFASYIKIVAVSAPAVERLITLTWHRNGSATAVDSSDRQIAYRLGHRYLSLLESVPVWEKELPNVKVYLDQISKNVEYWEKSGEVKSVDALLEELRKSRY